MRAPTRTLAEIWSRDSTQKDCEFLSGRGRESTALRLVLVLGVLPVLELGLGARHQAIS